ncbi:hypothetical protein BGX38DRAFT_1334080 [Terfezia claveryi]|nr:hypothetical protein BGX38DRAFT_1334080 [Terfezia claveryi]
MLELTFPCFESIPDVAKREERTKVLTLYSQGPALLTLKADKKATFVAASDALKQRFSAQIEDLDEWAEKAQAITDLNNLCQGGLTSAQYVEKANGIFTVLGIEYSSVLATKFQEMIRVNEKYIKSLRRAKTASQKPKEQDKLHNWQYQLPFPIFAVHGVKKKEEKRGEKRFEDELNKDEEEREIKRPENELNTMDEEKRGDKRPENELNGDEEKREDKRPKNELNGDEAEKRESKRPEDELNRDKEEREIKWPVDEPEKRRLIQFHRKLLSNLPLLKEQVDWFTVSAIKIGHELSLVYTIPTYPNTCPHRTKDPNYVMDEICLQMEKLPTMEGAIEPEDLPHG